MADNEETESTDISMSQMLIVGFIIVILIGLSYFFEDRNLKISYFMSVGLGLFTLFNVHMTIKYYKELRNAEGKQGPKGPHGEEGPNGEPGVCTFSSECGIDDAASRIASEISARREFEEFFKTDPEYEKFKDNIKNNIFEEFEDTDVTEAQRNVYKAVQAIILNAKTTQLKPDVFYDKVFKKPRQPL